jgi:hypothetical protein
VPKSLGRNLNEESQLTSLAGNVDGNDVDHDHELKTAPLLTRGAYRTKKMRQVVGQYGVFGTITESKLPQTPTSMQNDEFTRLYLNTNTPFSALVCGVQGSGKSHTVSVILENMFVTGCPALGNLVKPLSGLVLHVGETGACASPCEASYVGVSTVGNAKPPPVVVYVAPSSLKRMQQVYGRLGSNIEVKPLFFSPSELDAAAFLSLMAISSSDNAPLYMQTVLSILRELGDDYTYSAFMARIDEHKKDMNPAQKAGLKQRLDLLTTFTQSTRSPKLPHNARSSISTVEEQRFAAGRVTIVDLSDPFVDAAMAGAIFEICIRLFQRANVDTGKVLVVDEAHKYLSEANSTPTGLTRALLSLVRQQRHMSMRVIVSTQEPTVLPSAFIALCSVIILHRFASAAWWEHLKKHIPATMSSEDSFDRVVTLKTGEALVCCPTGVYVGVESGSEAMKIRLLRFSRNFLVVRTRRRVTADGGVSLMAV